MAPPAGRRPRLPLPRLLLRAALLAVCLPAAAPQPGGRPLRSFDENSWTRATWGDYMLEMPLRASQPSDDHRLASVRGLLEGCDHASIDGPGKRSLLPPQQRVPSISVVQGGQLDGRAVLAQVISKDHQVYPAAKAIQCPVCNSLVEDVFTTVQFVANLEEVMTEDTLAKLVTRVCDEKILHLVLGRYAVVSMPGAPKKGSTVPPPLSYSLKHRPISLPVNSKEINAVQKACSSVLLEIDDHIAERIAVSLRALQRKKAEFLAKQGKGEEAVCEDGNAQCALWALRGECTKNPVYMLYHCKASCGVCSGPRTSKFQELQDAAAERLKEETCGVLASCLEVAARERPAQEQPVPQGKVLKEQLEEGMEKPAERPNQSHQGAHGRAAVEKYIEQDLGDLTSKCIYLNQGWWTYQICYRLQIRQLHLEDKKVESQHELGTFDEALTAAGEEGGGELARVLEAADLLPDMAGGQQRYIRHIFSGGSPCEAAGSKLRHAELRITCSPNMGIHMKIREPEQCAYVIVLYLPALCQHPDYAPSAP